MSDPIDRREFARRAAAVSLAPGILAATPAAALAQKKFVANYDEAKVPEYTLPDPLRTSDGAAVPNARTWTTKRRPELLRLFENHVYGRTPTEGSDGGAAEHESDVAALGGLAKRSQLEVRFVRQGRPLGINVLVYAPAAITRPVPVFLGINFYGNQSIHKDPAIRLPESWVRNNKAFHITENRATDASRGVRSSRWPVETIVKRGYALVAIYYGDIDPDYHDRFKNGVHPLFDDFKDGRPDNAWGSIGGWAWGMSRVLDSLPVVDAIDTKRVIAFGHSRLGKTALWAGAQDERFAMTISNNSGCGGAALNRRAFGETVGRITTSFPHWFCKRYATYAERENELPVDQHELIALCAPRPVYIASAEADRWADPRGEFLSAKHAGPVYKLFDKTGVGVDDMPAIDKPVGDHIGYHVRTGKHDVTDYDWARYLDFADRHLKTH